MRGCLLMYECGCYRLDGVLAGRCEKHQAEHLARLSAGTSSPDGKHKADPELDAWAERHKR